MTLSPTLALALTQYNDTLSNPNLALALALTKSNPDLSLL